MKTTTQHYLAQLTCSPFHNRDTDDDITIKDMKPLGRKCNFLHCKTRKVNFVIFVVNGISVFESIDGKSKGYTEILQETFTYPFLSVGGRHC
jgi:hypothetical protein